MQDYFVEKADKIVSRWGFEQLAALRPDDRKALVEIIAEELQKTHREAFTQGSDWRGDKW